MYISIREFDKESLNKTEVLIHQACQFPAMMGKNFIKEKADDSHTNLEISKAIVQSRRIEGSRSFKVIIDPKKWVMGLLMDAEEFVYDMIPLAGHTKEQLFDWLKSKLGTHGLPEEQLSFIHHYQIPPHPLDDGVAFDTPDPESVGLWLQMRHNAFVLMKEINRMVDIPSDIRIWPHHFDTGTYYPLSPTTAIGAGWAMADHLVDHPYLYLYGWSEGSAIDYNQVPDLKLGEWKLTEQWNGLVIPLEVIVSESSQYSMILTDVEAALHFYKSQLTK